MAKKPQIPQFDLDDVSEALGNGSAHDEMRDAFLKLIDLEKQREALEKQVSEIGKRINQMKWTDLPELMREAGFGDDDLLRVNGYELRCADVLTVSGERAVGTRDEQIAWLVENGHGGLVKNTVAVGFAPNESAEAAELLLELKKKFDTTKRERKVESSTLKSAIRDNLAALKRGEEVPPFPLELFGAENRTTAEIKPVKKRS